MGLVQLGEVCESPWINKIIQELCFGRLTGTLLCDCSRHPCVAWTLNILESLCFSPKGLAPTMDTDAAHLLQLFLPRAQIPPIKETIRCSGNFLLPREQKAPVLFALRMQPAQLSSPPIWAPVRGEVCMDVTQAVGSSDSCLSGRAPLPTAWAEWRGDLSKGWERAFED